MFKVARHTTLQRLDVKAGIAKLTAKSRGDATCSYFSLMRWRESRRAWPEHADLVTYWLSKWYVHICTHTHTHTQCRSLLFHAHHIAACAGVSRHAVTCTRSEEVSIVLLRRQPEHKAFFFFFCCSVNWKRPSVAPPLTSPSPCEHPKVQSIVSIVTTYPVGAVLQNKMGMWNVHSPPFNWFACSEKNKTTNKNKPVHSENVQRENLQHRLQSHSLSSRPSCVFFLPHCIFQNWWHHFPMVTPT